MKTAIFFMLFGVLFEAGLAWSQPSPADLEKFRAEIQKTGNACPDTRTSQGTVRIQGPKGVLRVEFFKTGSKESASRKVLPTFGSYTQKCLDLQYFPKQELLVYRVYKGGSSPAAIEVTSLAVYKVKDGKLTGGQEYMLLDVDQDGFSDTVKTYRAFARGDDVILELTDHKESPPTVEEFVLSQMDYR
jgi:hypothetical protein